VNPVEFFPDGLEFPERPPWDHSMAKEVLDARENRYFTEYLKGIEEKFGWANCSYFELNLETWRQFWRVLEMSDILLIVADVRFTGLLIPPSVYKYVNNLGKSMIAVLNKVDLVPASVVVAWKKYLEENYPGIRVITFTSFPSYNLRCASENKAGMQVRRRKGKIRMCAEGAQKLFDECSKIVGDKVNISSWGKKIKQETMQEYEDDEVEIGEVVEGHDDSVFGEYKQYQGGILTLGCIGQPNVGKSSLINAVMGKKVVSVSRTPGHTKHFQTIFLTDNVRLCDCPGLVFPSTVPKELQVLMGSFPIAQLREPYSCIRYVGERFDIVRILQIQHPSQETEWSAYDICEGWANKKGFFTARAARPDVYRSANHLLRMTLEGKIPFYLTPKGYSEQKEFWESHPETKEVKWVQSRAPSEQATEPLTEEDSPDEESTGRKDSGESDSDDEGATSDEDVPAKTSVNQFSVLSKFE